MLNNRFNMLVNSRRQGIFENGKFAGIKSPYPQNAHLFWYIKDSEKENLALPVVVEFFLNYAQREDVKALFQIVGLEEVRDIFYSQINRSERVANNYFPLTRNFFKLYFQKYALGNT